MHTGTWAWHVLPDVHSQQLLLREWGGGEGATSLPSTSGLHSDSGHGSWSAPSASCQLRLPCFPGTQAITCDGMRVNTGRSWISHTKRLEFVWQLLLRLETMACRPCGHLQWVLGSVVPKACAHWQRHVILCTASRSIRASGNCADWSEGLLEPPFRWVQS